MLTVKVTDYVAEAKGVVLLELRDPQNKPLPPFEPGAHVEMHLPNGLIRHYSLLNDYRETDRYLVGVSRVADGSGGSQYVHSRIAEGLQLRISAPRNNFPLDPNAARYLFVAGGIGITPIMSMIRWCRANGREWRLVYAARNRQRTALYEDLKSFGDDRIHWHFDDERGAHLNVADALAGLRDGEQVYCCGPQPLMEAVEAAVSAYPPGTAHFEWFSARKGAAAPVESGAFEIQLKRSGISLRVPPTKSILEVLEENGFSVPFSCREGACRTCETGVCGGEPEHRDYVLSQEERGEGKTMMVCVSRSLGPTLCLDL